MSCTTLRCLAILLSFAHVSVQSGMTGSDMNMGSGCRFACTWSCETGSSPSSCPVTPPPPVDPCLSQPCLNGATCTSTGTVFTCTCADMFTGNLCETEIIPECGQTPIPPIRSGHGRVVGGEEAIAHSWPWQVSFQVMNQGYFHNCGGSIINERWILSAAHCHPGFYTSSIVVGAHDLTQFDLYTQRVNIDSMFIHPHYDSYDYWQNDMLLIKLSSNLTFSDHVSPVCLPDEGQEFADNLELYATGWGDFYRYGPSPDELHQVQINLINRETCNSNYEDELYETDVVTENQICAGSSTGDKGVCNGDSGGPLVTFMNNHWILVGLTSWGYDCDSEASFPGVYTRISNKISWIESTIAANS